jgi:hypothetical protein
MPAEVMYLSKKLKQDRKHGFRVTLKHNGVSGLYVTLVCSLSVFNALQIERKSSLWQKCFKALDWALFSARVRILLSLLQLLTTIVVEWSSLLLRIREVLDSNISPETDYPD